jgi:hypothetical protein
MFHTRADALMVGCLLAYGIGSGRFQRLATWAFRRRLQWIAVAWLPVSWIMTGSTGISSCS